MAKKKDPVPPNQRNAIHPWDEWFERLKANKSGKITIKNPTNYTSATHAMAVQVRRAAAKRGIKVGISIGDNMLTLIRK